MSSNKMMELTLEERKSKSSELMKKDPLRVPIILESQNELWDLPMLFVNKNFQCNVILKCLRENPKTKARHSITMNCNNMIISPDKIIETVYESNKNEDGFLHIKLMEMDANG